MTTYVDPVAANGAVEKWLVQVPLRNHCCHLVVVWISQRHSNYMGGPPKIGGKNPKWMVKIMENLIKMDDLGVPLFLKTPI